MALSKLKLMFTQQKPRRVLWVSGIVDYGQRICKVNQQFTKLPFQSLQMNGKLFLISAHIPEVVMIFLTILQKYKDYKTVWF